MAAPLLPRHGGGASPARLRVKRLHCAKPLHCRFSESIPSRPIVLTRHARIDRSTANNQYPPNRSGYAALRSQTIHIEINSERQAIALMKPH
ncbi:hypothetical protein ACVCIC_20535 [Burkholderia glumae]|uniref:Uncharacterized protein n=1 Tax=Burkholderia glumae TaxID=337 RepID=A0ABY5BM81_BURGL|nr:hypothetical protein [Burkholderia glumae]MCM2483197.1 hypothetical protein [Burkholderia glumae]MCM2506514.1 hypothetical protein [Burkholderia glumae]MCM2538185.1 hypothetical protein [Burkholderia glumae]USS47576.1 hypothetical protein NFI99_22435 [Burkholderia glumae]